MIVGRQEPGGLYSAGCSAASGRSCRRAAGLGRFISAPAYPHPMTAEEIAVLKQDQ
jgi:hypothetical protein